MMSAEPIVNTGRDMPLDLDSGKETRMFEDSKPEPRGRSARRSRSRHRRADRHLDDDLETTETLASIDESLLSDEDRAYHLAQKLADRKVELSRQVFRGALITVPLLIFVPALGAISLIYFGVMLGRKTFRLLYEPRLRERFLQEEVQRRVHTRVSDERRHLEGEHHRSLEQLSASIAHEIRNPITAAKSLVQQMGEDPNGSDQVEYARVAVAELERVEKSISHLLRFAREEDTQIDAVVMEDVLESALETFRDRAERSSIDIVRQYDSDGRLEGDSEQLRRVVINLVGNAIDALEEARIQAPEIRVSMGENLAGTEVWVRVSDNGLGIEDDVRGQIFDPFYTSREEGTGLGLAVCRKIVDNHGGSIEVESESGEGTVFILTFPRGQRSEANPS
jgi:signal transduction histidine kinase